MVVEALESTWVVSDGNVCRSGADMSNQVRQWRDSDARSPAPQGARFVGTGAPRRRPIAVSPSLHGIVPLSRPTLGLLIALTVARKTSGAHAAGCKTVKFGAFCPTPPVRRHAAVRVGLLVPPAKRARPTLAPAPAVNQNLSS